MAYEIDDEHFDLVLSSYRCAKGLGSEPEVGYQALSEALQSGLRVLLLTRRKDAELLERHPSSGSHLKVIGHELSPLMLRIKSVGLLPRSAYYICWQISIGRQLRRARYTANAAHHVTFATDWMPMGVLQLRDVPLLCGPIGGSTSLSVWRARKLGLRVMASLCIRTTLTYVPRRLLTRQLERHSNVTILLQNEDIAKYFSSLKTSICHNTSATWSQNHANLRAVPPETRAPVTKREVEIVFIGRLVPWKGVLFLIDVVAQWAREDQTTKFRINIYGDGRLTRAVSRKRLPANLFVKLYGHRPRDEVLSVLAKHPIVALPSVREGSPTIVTECVALGCPIVTMDVAGCGHLAKMYGITAVPITPGARQAYLAALKAAAKDPRPFIGSTPPVNIDEPNLTWRRWYSNLHTAGTATATSSPTSQAVDSTYSTKSLDGGT